MLRSVTCARTALRLRALDTRPAAREARLVKIAPAPLSSAKRAYSAASFIPLTSKIPITVAEGDGIGPEITHVVTEVIKASGAQVEFQHVEVGEREYRRGHMSGIAPETWDVIRKNKVMLKGPITTPSGGGYKSLNVTMRKTLGLYANVRPCISFHPFVATKHPIMDVVIVRENEEDLYAGIEHWQTNEVVQCLKLISRPGCEKICQYAFEYARRNGRKKVSCFIKDNIMKMTDGLFCLRPRAECAGTDLDRRV